MRGLAVFLFFCVALASASPHYESRDADKDFVKKQKDVFELLYHVHQPNIHKDQVTIGQSYKILDHLDQYNNPQFVKQVVQKYKIEKLPRGRIFSVIYSTHMHEAEDLFKVFYYAKDYETFYKTACWAREYLNEQLYTYALSVAVIHRHDTQGMVLPPPYEIHPYYFVSSEVLHQAYKVKMQEHAKEMVPHVHFTEPNVYVFNCSYFEEYVHYNEEEKLSYFTEDVGLNTLYYYFHLDYPFWMNGEEFGLTKDRRGERFYHFHQQLLARYYLERLSNGLGEIPDFSWKWPIETGYYPSLKYHNGMSFPHRPNHFDVKQEEFLHHLIQVEEYESRIRDSIDVGFLVGKDGTQMSLTNPEDIEHLASIVESNADTPHLRYYRYPLSLAKMLIGNSPRPTHKYKVSPSTLEQYQTALRDPMFYQLHKRYINYFVEFQKLLEPYTNEELVAPGVKVENVEVEKLVTYFDHFDVDITNAIFMDKDEVTKHEDSYVFKAREERLNHKPFSVTTNVVAEKAQKVLVKFFIGPKFDGQGHILSFHDNRLNFFELDKFVYELKQGKNTIERSSDEFMRKRKDFTTSSHLYQLMKSDSKFPLDMSEAHNSFPSRLVLPRGRKGGMPFSFYVIVAPYKAPVVEYGTGYDHVISSGVGSGARDIDGHSYGYPFDRPVNDEHHFYTNNMHMHDVLVYHKREVEVNQAVQN